MHPKWLRTSVDPVKNPLVVDDIKERFGEEALKNYMTFVAKKDLWGALNYYWNLREGVH